tara:strand:+ start:305 stop:499 length:195 start_codon:yes stop_codon:yes gene_type:complete
MREALVEVQPLVVQVVVEHGDLATQQEQELQEPHVKEMTEEMEAHKDQIMAEVAAVELVLQRQM